MQVDYDGLMKNQAWVLEDILVHKNHTGFKWVYKVKHKPDGTLDKHITRLVAKVFAQYEGMNYDETFTPIVKMVTIMLVLALVVHFGWIVFQMDVKSAFLNGQLEEETYMYQPQGFKVLRKEHMLCKLVKALYVIKQTQRVCYIKIDKHLQDRGFRGNFFDSNLYVKSEDGNVVLLVIYADDIIIVSGEVGLITKVKFELCSTFDVTDLGLLHYYLVV